jgi:hypothetical protein
VGPGSRVRGWAAAFAEMKRRTTTGGGVLLMRRFAFSTHGGRRPRSMTRGPGPPCQRLGHPGTRRGEIFYGVSGRQWGNLCLKRDSPKRGSHSHRSQRPFALECCVLFYCRSSHGLARSSRAPPARGGTQLGVQLPGWGVPAFAGKIRVGASPHGNLTAGEFVFFVSNLPSGLALPISSFFVLLLEELGLQSQHFTPCFILQAAIIAYLCKVSVGVTLLPPSSSSIRREGCSPAL